MRQWSFQAFGWAFHLGMAPVAEVRRAAEPPVPEPAPVEPGEPKRGHFEWSVPDNARLTGCGDWPKPYEDPDIA